MALSSAFQCFFFLVLIAMVQTHARESRFFSKVTHPTPTPTPTTSNPKPESEVVSPSPSPSPFVNTEKGYGLSGQEETYQYPPTTKNPTKSAPGKFNYVQAHGAKETSYGAGERQGMSDTRFLENGRYFYDVENEKKVGNSGELIENDDGHEIYYGYNHENGKSLNKERYGTGEKQGMSDTRFMENGRYFYDIQADKKNSGNGYEMINNNLESNNVEFYNNNENEVEEEEEEEEEKFEKEGYGAGEKQGMSDTRFLEKGRYFYDINAEKNGKNNGYGNNVVFYNNDNNKESYETNRYEPEKFSYHSSEGRSYGSYEQENEKYNGNGNGYDFRSTPNKFPKYEFDSMEEYEKYVQNGH